jgi:D-xylulose kinase
VVTLGIDSGTQSTKAILFDLKRSRVIGTGSAPHRLLPHRDPAVKEQDPSDWVLALQAAVRQALAKAPAGTARKVAGLAVSGQQHGFVPLDANDRVIRPAKLWCDTSTAAEAEGIIRRNGGLRRLIQKTGNGLPAGFTASKILWLKKHEPRHYARLATVLLPHDYLNFWLTGEKTMECGDASGTGFFDVRRRKWSDPVLRSMDARLTSFLPRLIPPGGTAGDLSVFSARALGLRPGIPVAPGGGDNMMGAIGTGNVVPGVVTLSLGTSGTIYAYSDRPAVDPEGEVAAFCDSTGGWLPLVCTMNVTIATEAMGRVLGLAHQEWTRLAEKVRAGSDGLRFIPYLQGERTPNLPHATASYEGLNLENFTAGHLARATLEGISEGLNYGLKRLRSLGIRPREIRLTGGGSKNPLWRQILADIFQLRVVKVTSEEGAALGAALQAAWVISGGGKDNLNALTKRHVRLASPTCDRPSRTRL